MSSRPTICPTGWLNDTATRTWSPRPVGAGAATSGGCAARFLRGLHDAVKAADPDALTTISAADVYPTYSIVQGFSLDHLGFVDLVAEKSFGGTQDGFRWMYAHLRSGGTQAALSNLNSYQHDPSAGELAETVRRYVRGGGKLLLLPNAARFDEHGRTVEWFGASFPQQMVALKVMRDYVGWEQDIGFPFDASIVLLDRLDGPQMDDICRWAGVAPALTFMDPPPPPTNYVLGACREAETVQPFRWRQHVSVYPLVHPDGRRVFILVQRGTPAGPVADLAIAWDAGPVHVIQPPSPEAIACAPRDGRLALPVWREVVMLVAGAPE